MRSIYEGKYKEGEYFKDYQEVKTLDEACDHTLVHAEGIECYGPHSDWTDTGYMYRVNLSNECVYFWVSDEIGEHMSAINLHGDTEQSAREQVLWLLNESFSFYKSDEI